MNDNKKWSEEKSSILSKLLFLWTGKYINSVNSQKKARTPLHVPEKYSISKVEKRYEEYWKIHSYTKKNVFLCNYRVFQGSFLVYVCLLTLSIILSNMVPVLFQNVTTLLKEGNVDAAVVLKLMGIFFAVQIGYAIIKTHATHFKWKLVTAIDYNTKNLIYNNMIESDIEELNQGKILNIYASHTSKLKGITGLVDLIIYSIGLLIGIYELFLFLGIAGLISGVCFVLIMVISSRFTFLQDKYDKQNYDMNEVRLKCISTVLEKLREIKLLNYGRVFCQKLNEIREEHSKILKKRCRIQLFFGIYETSLIPVFTAVALVFAGIVFKMPLKTTDILTSFIIFDLLDSFTNQIFMALDSFRMCLKSLDYIVEFLGKKNPPKEAVNGNKSIHLENVSVSINDKFILRDLGIKFEKQELITINGAIASGKSLLLKVLNGDFPVTSGNVERNGIVSFISNDGWFLNDSVKNNIVLGKKFDERLYEEAIHYSCLDKDVQSFAEKDMLLITEGGTNLSGGQRVRLQIARAIYQRADILLIDDVFSSLDKENRELIIKKLLLTYWKDKIRIVVTNDASILKNADKTYQIEDKGLRQYIYEEKQQNLKDDGNTGYEKIIKTNKKSMKMEDSEKDRETISSREVLLRYLRKISFRGMWFFFIFFFVLSQVIDMFGKTYSTKIENSNSNVFTFTIIYCLLVILSIVISAIRCAIIYYGNIKAGKAYHERLVQNVIEAKYSFVNNAFLNKAKTVFSNDIRILDDNIADYFMNVFQALVLMITTCVVIVWSNPINIVFVSIFVVIFYYGQKAGKNVTTYVVRECNIANEPCVGYLCNTYNGRRLINNFQCGSFVKKSWKSKLEKAYDYEYTRQSVNRYELLKINIAAVLLLAVFLIVSLMTKANISIVMVTITYMLSIISKFEDILRNIRHSEIGLESLKRIERMKYFEDSDSKTGFSEIMEDNGCENAIEVENLACHYGDGNYIIRDCSFTIKRGEHVLIQGESGIGKTTIFNCLERLIDYEGRIMLFGQDIRIIKPEVIREKVFILTQNPMIFDGTIKENIDPYNRYSMESLKNCLQKFQLGEYQLDTECSHLSEGEKQLLCLARAYIKRPLILLIDEGMDNLDSAIKQSISLIINTQFRECTIVSISHLGNEMEYEGKIVLDR